MQRRVYSTENSLVISLNNDNAKSQEKKQSNKKVGSRDLNTTSNKPTSTASTKAAHEIRASSSKDKRQNATRNKSSTRGRKTKAPQKSMPSHSNTTTRQEEHDDEGEDIPWWEDRNTYAFQAQEKLASLTFSDEAELTLADLPPPATHARPMTASSLAGRPQSSGRALKDLDGRDTAARYFTTEQPKLKQAMYSGPPHHHQPRTRSDFSPTNVADTVLERVTSSQRDWADISSDEEGDFSGFIEFKNL